MSEEKKPPTFLQSAGQLYAAYLFKQRSPSTRVKLVFGTLVFLTAWDLSFLRKSSTIAEITIVIGILLVLCSLMLAGRMARQGELGIPASDRTATISGLLFVIGSVMALGAYLTMPATVATLTRIYLRIRSLPSSLVTAGGTLLLALFGLGLFQLKQKLLLIYAYAEITFALVSCYIAVSRLKPDKQTVTILGGAVYLVVRGLDNRKKGMEQKSDRQPAVAPESPSA